MHLDWKSAGAGFLLGLVGGTLLGRMLSKLGNKIIGFFKAMVDATRKEFNEQVESGQYDFNDDFDSTYNEHANQPGKVRTWLKRYINGHRYQGILLQGHLYMFNYLEPKTEEHLEYFDTSPLILSFGTYMANTGNLVEYGVNLHFLPLKVRKAFMSDIFDLFKKRYKGKMYSDKPRQINEFTWEQLKPFVDKYCIDFAVRSYITTLRTSTISFDYKDWAMATLIPSRGFKAGGKAIQNKYDEKVINVLYAKHLALHRAKLRQNKHI